MKKETITNFVILVVVILWAASIVTLMFDHSFQIPGTLQLIMSAVAAYLFGKQVMAKARTKGDREEIMDEAERKKTELPPKG